MCISIPLSLILIKMKSLTPRVDAHFTLQPELEPYFVDSCSLDKLSQKKLVKTYKLARGSSWIKLQRRKTTKWSLAYPELCHDTTQPDLTGATCMAPKIFFSSTRFCFVSCSCPAALTSFNENKELFSPALSPPHQPNSWKISDGALSVMHFTRTFPSIKNVEQNDKVCC